MICGPMFCGKTAELIRRVKRERIAGTHVQIFKFQKDVRYAREDQMASNDGGVLGAIPATASHEIISHLDRACTIVVIDEVQFFDSGIVDVVRSLVERGTHVMCAGLTLDFRGEPFVFSDALRSMADLLVYADDIVQLHAVCTYAEHRTVPCGKSATRTQRIINGHPALYTNPVVVIGSTELYEARCVAHHLVPGKPIIQIPKAQKVMQCIS